MNNRIRELREKAGLSQKALAEMLGTPAPTVCCWEQGRNDPSRKYLLSLVNLFGVSGDYILGISDETGEPTAEDRQQGVVDSLRIIVTADEVELLEAYREAAEDRKRLIKEIVKLVSGNS